MDGLHLEAAGRFDGHGEQRARVLDFAIRSRADRTGRRSAAPARTRQRHPLRQRVEHALRHLGRGGLGVGEAEDAFRLGAGEQQPQHALRQHVRLAGAGVGADPGGGARIGGVALGTARVVAQVGVDAVAPTSCSRIPRPRRAPTIRRRAPGARSRRSRSRSAPPQRPVGRRRIVEARNEALRGCASAARRARRYRRT